MNKKIDRLVKIVFFAVTILIILLLLSFCQRQNKLVLDGIKITNIKQSVDSFNGDTIFLNTKYQKDKEYEYDVTIHNYLDEDYYLYKIEVSNEKITYNNILKLLKNKKDTNIKLKLTSKEETNERFNVKFYYGKIKNVKIDEEIVAYFGNEKIKLPSGKQKQGYTFLGYTNTQGSDKVKYITDTEYDLKDGTVLYSIYKENDKKDTNDDNKQTNYQSQKYIVNFDPQNGDVITSKEVTYNEKYGELPLPNRTGYSFLGWYLDNTLITNESIVNITSNVTLKAKYNIINYAINYDLDGGVVTGNPESYTIQSSDIILKNPTKAGAVFIGWTGSNGTTPEKNIIIPSGSTGMKDYKAIYSDNDLVHYKVIYKLEKLDGTFEIKKQEILSAPYGSIVSPKVIVYEGFVSPQVKSTSVNQDGTTEVVYEYLREKYTLSYTNKENIDLENSTAEGKYLYETQITVVAKDKIGYTFTGWSNGITTRIANFSIKDNINITPVYTAKKYNVIFNANGAQGSMNEQEFTYDIMQELSQNAFTKTGYVFTGWNTKSDGTGTNYSNRQIVKNLTTNNNIVLYAQFIIEQYNVIFNTDGGNAIPNILRNYGSQYGTLPIAEKTGYTFEGWYIENQKIESTSIVTSNVTLKAKYNIIRYTISYNLNGGEIENPTNYTVEDEIILNNPTKIGYTFSGWTGSNGESLQTKVTIRKGTTGNLNYNANYSVNQNTPYKVIHKKQNLALNGYDVELIESLTGATNTTVSPEVKEYTGFISPQKSSLLIKPDGTATIEYLYQREIYRFALSNENDIDLTNSTSAGNYPYGTQITVVAKQKEGYTFTGWNTGSSDLTTVFNISDNIVLYPNYTKNNYVVIFNSNNGNGTMDNQEFTYDEEQPLNKNLFNKPGYTFTEWNTKSDGTGTSYADEQIVKNLKSQGSIILYARWVANTNTPYKVIYRKQNLDLTTYTDEVENKTGTTDTTVTPSVRNYDGFISPNTQTITIKGDGTSEVIYIYNRRTYTFTLENRENVETSAQDGTYPYGTQITLKAKEVPGYTFDGWSNGDESRSINIQLIDNISIKPIYTAKTNTPYKVIHRKQNVDLTTYTDEVENKTGTTGSSVTPGVKTYTGFISPNSQTITIKGDGTSEAIYIYNRVKYTFTLENRENVETSVQDGTYPYGTQITLKAKEIPGYTFTGWTNESTSKEITLTLEDNISIRPIYTANTDTPYKVIHRKQNVDLTTYTDEVENKTGTTGSSVTPSVKTYTGFISPETQTITIKGDGTSEAIYIYNRVKYTFTLENRENVETSVQDGTYPYGTQITLKAKEIPGYTFTGWTNESTSKEITLTLEDNISIRPIYTANTDTPYKVIHRKQNVDLTTYTDEVENKTGTTGASVTPGVKTYTGFISPNSQTITIKGDGTSEVVYIYNRIKYTFTLQDRNNVETSAQDGEYPYGAQITLKAKEIPGYTFTGWTNGETTKEITLTLEDNITIKPIYASRTDTPYKVIHRKQNVDLTTYTDEVENKTGTTGASVTPGVKTYTGFISPNSQAITIKGDGTSEVVYIYNRIKYTFTLQDRNNVETSAQDGEYPYGAQITLKAKEISGYTFTKWSNEDTTNPYTMQIIGNITIKPIYTANKYNVIFNANTGLGNMADQEITYDQETSLNKNTFVKSGYIFAGWNTKSDGTGTVYLDEANVKNLKSNGSIVLYAQWVARNDIAYKVIHRKQNLDLTTYTEEVENKTGTTDTIVTPSVKTYTGFISPDTQSITIKADGTSEVVYVYNRRTYTFTLEDRDNVETETLDGTYPYETQITLKAKEIPGYTFTKWSNESTSKEITLTLEDNISIRPIYTANTNTPYKITHRKQNLDLTTYTDEVEDLTGTTDTEVTPSVKTYTGFISPNTQSITIKGDGTSTLIYVYNRRTYTFTLEDRDNVETNVQDGEYPYETQITLKAKEKAGYTFTGWTNGENETQIAVTLTDNITIKPIYTANTNTPYKVIHRKQNLDLTTYTEEVENLTGTTDTTVTPTVKTYTGFISPNTQNMTIKGDGTSEIVYVYNRKTYTFTLEDREYVETETLDGTYPYGTVITLTAKEKIGYTFTEWTNGDTTNPYTMQITGNITIKPVYEANTNTPYKVVHRKQNLDLTTYTEEVEDLTGTTDTEVTPSVKTYTGFTSPNTQTITIKGDGSSKVIYVYNRKMYNFTVLDREYVETDTLDGAYPYETQITLTAKEKTGYTFTSWSNNETSKTITINLTSAITMQPIYSINSYTVTFNPNGGTTSETSRQVNYNDKVGELPIAEKEDKVFVGWYTGITDGLPIDENTVIVDNIIYYAHYTDPHAVFTYGSVVNQVMNNLAGDNTVTEILQYKQKPSSSVMTNDNKVSVDEESNTPIYMWYENNKIYYYSIDKKPSLNADSASMFKGFAYVTQIEGIDDFETDDVVSIEYMFKYCFNLTNLDLSKWNTDKIENMHHAFEDMFVYNTNNYTLNISSFNMQKINNNSTITDNYLFGSNLRNDINVNLIANNIKLPSNSSYLFSSLKGFTINGINTWDTSIVTNMNYMFTNETLSKTLTIDLSDWDTSKVTSMRYIFSNGFTDTTKIYTLNINNLDMSKFNTGYYTGYLFGNEVNGDLKVTLKANNIKLPNNSSYLFAYLKGFTIEGINTWDTSKVENMNYMFTGGTLSNLSNINLSSWDTSKVESMYYIFSNSFKNDKDDYVINISNWDISKIGATEEENYLFGNTNNAKGTIVTNNIKLPVYSNYLFAYLQGFTLEGIHTWDTSEVEDMSYLFAYGSISKTALSLDNFNTSRVESMEGMFKDNTNLTLLDITSFNTVNVTNMKYMLSGCTNLTTVYVSDIFTTQSVNKSDNMFLDDIKIKGGKGTTYNQDYIDKSYAHYDYGTSNPGYFINGTIYTITFNPNGGTVDELSRQLVYGSKLGTLPEPEKEGYVFIGWYTGITDGFVIDENTIVEGNTTYYAHYVESKATFDMGQIVNGKMMALAGNNRYIYSIQRTTTKPNINSMTPLNVISSDDSYVKIYAWYQSGTIYYYSQADELYLNPDSSVMFANLPNLASLDLSKIDTSNVINMYAMFGNDSNLTTLNLDNINTSKVTNMMYMFASCLSLSSIDVTNFDTSKVENMSGMFAGCNQLTEIDVSGFETVNVTNMNSMFASCGELTTLNVSGFVTSKVTDMSTMFGGCSKLTQLDVSRWDTSKVENMSTMFGECSGLTQLDVSRWDTSKVENMSGMFNGMSLTELNLSNFNTSKVTNMSTMFASCANLTSLNIKSFDTSIVVDMNSMFEGCSSLTSLDISNFDTSKVENMSKMFKNCSNIETIYVSDDFVITSLSTTIESSTEMFLNDEKLVGGKGTIYDENHIDKSYARIDEPNINKKGYFTNRTIYTITFNPNGGTVSESTRQLVYGSKLGTLPEVEKEDLMFDAWYTGLTDGLPIDENTIVEGNTTYYAHYIAPNAKFKEGSVVNAKMHELAEDNNITQIVRSETKAQNLTEDNIVSTAESTTPIYMWYQDDKIYYYTLDETPSLNEDSSSMFKGLDNVTLIDEIEIWDTSDVINMNSMFEECSSLEDLDLSSWDTSNVTDMQNIFNIYTSLTEINISGWDMSNINKEPQSYEIDDTVDNYLFGSRGSVATLETDEVQTRLITNNIILPSDSSYLFAGLEYFGIEGIDTWNTDNVTNMEGLFAGTLINQEEVDLSNWDVSNVTDMGMLFKGSLLKVTDIDVSTWDTSNVTDMNRMFQGYSEITNLDLSNFNTSNVTDMLYIFNGNTSLTEVNISGWDMSNINKEPQSYEIDDAVDNYLFAVIGDVATLEIDEVKTRLITDDIKLPSDSSYLFAGLEYYGIEGLNTWNTDDVTNMEGLFAGTLINQEEVDLSNWDVSNVTNMGMLFKGSLIKVTDIDVSTWDTSNVTDMNRMFQGYNAITNLDLGNFNTSNVTNMNRMFQGHSEITNLDLSNFNTSNVTEFDHMLELASLTSVNISNFDMSKWTRDSSDWYSRGLFQGNETPSLETITITNAKLPSDSSYFFENLSSLTELVGINTVDTSEVASMDGMFYECSSLTELDLSGWDTSNVTSAYYIFDGCYNLTTLNLSDWNVSHVTDLYSILGGCYNLTALNLSGWDVSNATDIPYMFNDCNSVTELNLSRWNVSNVAGMGGMFNPLFTLQTLDLSDWIINSETNLTGVFDGLSYDIELIDISNWDMSNSRVTYGSSSVSTLETDEVKTRLITNDIKLPSDSSYLFAGLEYYGIEGIDTWDTSVVTNMEGLVGGTLINQEVVDLSNWNVSNVTNMKETFKGSLLKVTDMDVSTWNTSKVTDMSRMFQGYSEITNLDLSSFNTSNVTDFEHMLELTSLTSVNISNFDMSKWNNRSSGPFIKGLFQGESTPSIETIIITNAKLPSDSSNFFFSLSSLTELVGINTVDTSDVTDMYNMFKYCGSLEELDLSNWDVSNVTNMSSMFEECNSLTELDISGWDTSEVASMGSMFSECSSLTTIYASESFVTDKLVYPNGMFDDCESLVGGNGTYYEYEHIDQEYARIDTDDTPGYFTSYINTITYNSNNGSNNILKQTINSRLSNKLNANTFTWDDREFLGWNTKKNGRGTAYLDEEIIPANTLSSNIVLYAQWSEDPTYEAATFDAGKVVNGKLKRLAGNSSATYLSSNDEPPYIQAIVRTDIEPDLSAMTEDNIISSPNSNNVIYAWYIENSWEYDEEYEYDNAIYYYSEANKLYLNEDSSYMFNSFNNLVTLDMSDFNTSKVTDMSFMFATMENGQIATSYSNSSSYELDLSNFNTSKVTNMKGMFLNYDGSTLDVSSFNTSNVTDMSFMFAGCFSITTLNLDNFNTSKVTDMSFMFSDCRSLTSLDLSNFNVSHVTDMSYIFYDCYEIEQLNITNWDMSNCTFDVYYNLNINNNLGDLYVFGRDRGDAYIRIINGGPLFAAASHSESKEYKLEKIIITNAKLPVNSSGLFAGLGRLNNIVGINTVDTSNVTDMQGMFNRCSSLTTLDLSNWDTSNVTNISWMFEYCGSLTELNISTFNTKKVEKMYSMFYGCYDLTTLDLSSFDTNKVTDMSYMFDECHELQTIYVSDKFVTTNVTISDNMFEFCESLVGGSGTPYDVNHIDKEYARIDDPTNDKPGYFTYRASSISAIISFNANEGTGTMESQEINPKVSNTLNANKFIRDNYEFMGWNTEIDGSGAAYLDEDVIPANTINSNTTLYAQWLEESNETATFDTGIVVNEKLKKLTGLINSTYETQNTNITSIKKSRVMPDINNMTSDNIISSSDSDNDIYAWYKNGIIYYYTSAGKIYLNEDSSSMFYNMTKITSIEGVNKWNTSNVTDMHYMFNNCNSLEELDLSRWNVSNVINMNSMFEDCSSLEELDLSRWNVSNVTDMESIFSGFYDLKTLNISNWNMSNSSGYLFGYNGHVATLTSDEVKTRLITNNIILPSDSSRLFAGLSDYGIEGIETWDTSHVTKMRAMIGGTLINQTTLDLNGWDVSNVTDMGGLFTGSLLKVTDIDISTWNTSNVMYMDGMFIGYTSISDLNLSNFNTSKVIDFNGMFDTIGITSLNISNWDMSNWRWSENYYPRFGAGESREHGTLQALTITNAKLPSKCNMIFYGLESLNTIYGLNTVDTSKVDYMFNMFYNFDNIVTLDLSGWDTSNVTDMSYMFESCDNLVTLDLSGWDTSNVTDMMHMFINDKKLTTIYVSEGFVTNKVTNSGGMFYDCENLVGGSGTPYNESHFDKEYARIDDPTNDRPGYFTYKAPPISITISFNANGGTGTMENQVIRPTVDNTLKANTFTRQTHKFIGWNTQADGSGTSYTDKQVIQANTLNSNTTLYAQWIKHGWEFENEATWNSSTDELKDQKWIYYRNGQRVENELIYVNGTYKGTGVSMHNYLIENGYMYIGWHKNANNKWNFYSWFDLDENGYVEGYRFEGTEEEPLVKEINGETYTFNKDGESDKTPPIINPDYIVSDADTLICTLDGRTFTKANNGSAIVGYFHDDFTHPLLISENQDAVAFKTNFDSTVHSYSGTYNYHGTTYYISSWNYGMPGSVISTGGVAKLISNNSLSYDDNSAVEALLAKAYNYIPNGSSTNLTSSVYNMTKSGNKFVVPKDAYKLRKYFMGINY